MKFLIVSVHHFRAKWCQVILRPLQIGWEGEGVSKIAWKSISQCDIDLRKSLMGAIVLSGTSPGVVEGIFVGVE